MKKTPTTCWRVEVEFETSRDFARTEIEEYVTAALDSWHGRTSDDDAVRPSNVHVVSLIIQKPLPPPSPSPTVKRRLKR